MKKRAIIVDIDGCMLDDRNILQHLPAQANDREGWNAFNKHLWKCEPIRYMFDIVNSYKGHVIFVTARECFQHVLAVTNESLNEVDYNYSLFMREENDYRPSNEVKKDIYDNYIKDNYIIDFAIDDREENIKMWQSLGIPTLQHRYGE
jgi:predicted secreted acid phosphatase